MQEIRSKETYLNGADDDIVDGDEDELDEKSNKTHHNESDRGTQCNLREL